MSQNTRYIQAIDNNSASKSNKLIKDHVLKTCAKRHKLGYSNKNRFIQHARNLLSDGTIINLINDR